MSEVIAAPPLPDFLGFTSVPNEIRADRLPVTGTLPDWLAGTLIRNGPGKFEIGDYRMRSWFNGLAMLHAFTFGGGEVSYTNRYLRSETYQRAERDKQFFGKQFGPDPCGELFGQYFAEFSPNVTDNNGVNVARLTDRFVALTESPIAMQFDPRTLATLGPAPFSNPVDVEIATPHPHRDVPGAALLNYGTTMGEQSAYQVFYIPDGTLEQRVLCRVPTAQPCYMHSFGMSEHYVVLAEFPVLLDPIEFLDEHKSVLECARWTPERGTRFVVIDKREGAVVRTFETEACFAFHHINMHERGSELILDLTATRTPFETVLGMPATAEQLNLKRYGYTLRRYRLPLSGRTSAVDHEVLSEVPLEMPRINYQHHNTRDYRYVYGLSQTPGSRAMNQLAKIDITDGSLRSWHERGCFPGEAVFVPAPDATAEDDGVALSAVLDVRTGTSFLLVLDGASFTELARASVPQHIPSDFHGQFYGDLR